MVMCIVHLLLTDWQQAWNECDYHAIHVWREAFLFVVYLEVVLNTLVHQSINALCCITSIIISIFLFTTNTPRYLRGFYLLLPSQIILILCQTSTVCLWSLVHVLIIRLRNIH